MCKIPLDVYAELIFTPMSIYNCDRYFFSNAE